MPQPPSSRFVQVRLGSQLTPGCMTVFGVLLLSFVLSILPVVGKFVRSELLLEPSLALGRQPWRLLTAPFFVLSPFALLFLGLLLWSLGSAIEQRIGPRRIIAWSAVVLLCSSLVVALSGRLHALFAPATGLLPIPMEAAPLFAMVLLSFAQLYGGLQVRMWGVDQQTSGRTLAWFFIGIGLLADLFRGEWELLCANLATLLVTFALLSDHGGQSPWRLLRRKLFGLRPSASKPSGRKFDVLDGGRDRDPAQKWLN